MTIDSFHFHWTSCFISEFTKQSTSVGHPRCLIKVVNECRYIKPLIHTRVGWYGRLSSRLTFIIETSGTLRHCMVISNVNHSIQFEQSKLGWVVRDSSMPMVWIVPVKHWTEPFLEGWEDNCSKANHTQASQKALKDAFLNVFCYVPLLSFQLSCVTHPILNRRMHIHIGGRWADGIVPIRPQLTDKWWNVVSHTWMMLLSCIVGVWYVFLVDDDDRPKGDVRFGHQSANTRDAIEYSTGDPANASPSSGIWYYSMI